MSQWKYIFSGSEPLCEIFSSIELFTDALDIQEGWKYSFYDSFIITAALKSNCQILFSEDLQHEQRIRDLVILNPFIDEGRVAKGCYQPSAHSRQPNIVNLLKIK